MARSRSPVPSAKKRQNSDQQRSPWMSLLDWGTGHPSLSFALLSGLWILVLYWRAFWAPFVYDDLDQIVNNPSLGSWHAAFTRFFLSPVAFTSNFRGVGGSTYRPLLWFTFVLDRRIWGAAGAGGFHLTNVVLHWANGVLLFLLLRRLRVDDVIAAAAALLWIGLPINSEAVTWVSGRAYLLCALFLLLSLFAAHSYLSRKRRFLLAYFALSLAALLCHEAGFLVLPLTVLLVYASGPSSRRVWTSLLGCTLGADLLYLAAKHLVGARGGEGGPSLWAIGLTFWKYVQWILAPVHLSVERSTSTPPPTASPAALCAWAALLALFAAIVLLRRKMPPVAGGLATLCVCLLPFCGAVFIYQGMAERFAYFASAGLALALAGLLLQQTGAKRTFALSLLLLLIVWSAWRTTERVLDWTDPVSLYESSLKATPNSPTLFYNLAYTQRERGDLEDAATNYRRATQLLPTYQHAFASLGEVYARLNRPAEAVDAFRSALALEPCDAATALSLGVAYQQLGDRRNAELEFNRAITLAPGDSAAFTDLGVLLFAEGRIDNAIKCFQRAIEIRPQDPSPYFNLAVLFQQSGRDELALPFYKKVLELKPGDHDTISNLSKLHLVRQP